MKPPIVRPPATRWECPHCKRTDVTFILGPHSHFHQCAALKGAWAPFVQAGVRAALVVDYREDYVGKELVTYDGHGRPVTAIRTVRDDGEDCHVFVPCALGRLTAG